MLKKRQSIYEEKYKKGTEFTVKAQLLDFINRSDVQYLLAHGKNDDGTEYMNIRVDGISQKKTTKKK